jgi:hypothetical protein
MVQQTDRTTSTLRTHDYRPPTLSDLINSSDGWIGVDLDGCLAEYTGWKGLTHIGPPIEPMVSRVKIYLEKGREVRIFTARADLLHSPEEFAVSKAAIESWCLIHIGKILPITCTKDRFMVVLFDDRAVRIVSNNGKISEL